MDGRLSFVQVILLFAYAAAMAGGQILFKLAAVRSPAGSLGQRLAGLFYNGFFSAAVVLYALLAVLWVWILTFTPLSRAYAFVALAFILTPLAGSAVFGEPISFRFVVGVALIAVGLVCIAG